jgi:hypothetical protein
LARLKIQNNSTLEYIIRNRKQKINDEITQEEQIRINEKLREDQERKRDLFKERRNNVVPDSASTIQSTSVSIVDSTSLPSSSSSSSPSSSPLSSSSSLSETSTSSSMIAPTVIPTTALHVRSTPFRIVLPQTCTATSSHGDAFTPLIPTSTATTTANTISDSSMTNEKDIPSYWIKSENVNTGDVLQQKLEQRNDPNIKSDAANNNAIAVTLATGLNQQQQKYPQIQRLQQTIVTPSEKRITKRKKNDDDDYDDDDGSDTRTMSVKGNQAEKQILSLKVNQVGIEDKKKARRDKISRSDGICPPLTDTHCSDGINVERDTMTLSSKPPPPLHSIRPPERAPTRNAPSLTSSIITDKSKCQYDHLCNYLF